ncbi:MFS domain-containing protein, partial [Haematococcus lacustris]
MVPLLLQMIVSLGWPSVFWSFGSLGIVWAAVWKFLASSNPAKCPLTSSQERSYILANTLGADSIAPGAHSPPSTSVTTKAASGAVAVEGGADGVAAGAEGGSTLVIPWRALLSR